MGHQIIKTPDGAYAVFSSFTDTWIMWNASPQELEDYYAERAAQSAREGAARMIALVEENSRQAYFQFTLTFEEANQASIEHGGADLAKPEGEEEHA